MRNVAGARGGARGLAIEVSSIIKAFKTYPDGKEFRALDGVSLRVYRGDFIVIAGANGSGKTLLMSIIAGLDEPDSGGVTLFGEDGQKRPGIVFQEADAQILGETPEEDVQFGLKSARCPKSELAAKTERALGSCGLLEKKDFPARLMSGGEKRRLAVASILALERETIILDEPFANLDWPGVRQVCKILEKLKAEGRTVLVLTHEIEKILALADRFVVLDRGRVRFDGSPEEGLRLDLEQFGIRNPLAKYESVKDMLWK